MCTQLILSFFYEFSNMELHNTSIEHSENFEEVVLDTSPSLKYLMS